MYTATNLNSPSNGVILYTGWFVGEPNVSNGDLTMDLTYDDLIYDEDYVPQKIDNIEYISELEITRVTFFNQVGEDAYGNSPSGGDKFVFNTEYKTSSF